VRRQAGQQAHHDLVARLLGDLLGGSGHGDLRGGPGGEGSEGRGAGDRRRLRQRPEVTARSGSDSPAPLKAGCCC
jgi:hypothetical protein